MGKLTFFLRHGGFKRALPPSDKDVPLTVPVAVASQQPTHLYIQKRHHPAKTTQYKYTI